MPGRKPADEFNAECKSDELQPPDMIDPLIAAPLVLAWFRADAFRQPSVLQSASAPKDARDVYEAPLEHFPV